VLNRPLDTLEIFDVERRAQSVKNFRKVIGELLVSELVRFDEVLVAENGFRPLPGQPGPLLANEVGKSVQWANACIGHDGSIHITSAASERGPARAPSTCFDRGNECC
jgi:hypothetical protein